MTEVNRDPHNVHFDFNFMSKMNMTSFNCCLYLVFLFLISYIITASCHGPRALEFTDFHRAHIVG